MNKLDEDLRRIDRKYRWGIVRILVVFFFVTILPAGSALYRNNWIWQYEKKVFRDNMRILREDRSDENCKEMWSHNKMMLHFWILDFDKMNYKKEI